jgi:hypothetical protein
VAGRLFSPQPQVLQEGEGDLRQHQMVVQADPASALVVAQAQLLLELLVRLLAHPPGLDRRGQVGEGRIGRVVAQVVLALAAGPLLAHQPSFLARQVLGVAVRRPVRPAHPQGGEFRRERPLAPDAPCDRREGGRPLVGEQVLDRHAGGRRDRVLGRAACASAHRLGQGDAAWVDLLRRQDAHGKGQPALGQAPPEGGARPVAGIRDDAAETGAGGHHAVDLVQRDPPLRPMPEILGDAGAAPTPRVGTPSLRQVEAQADRHRHLAPSERERDEHLAIGALAQLATVLPGDADRVLALLGQPGSPVSSTTRTASGPPTSSSALAANTASSGAVDQGEPETKWCSCCTSPGATRPVIGSMLLRSPGPSKPQT